MSPRTLRRPGPAASPVVVEGIWPIVEGGRFPVKAVAGQPLVIGADVFAHGHDRVRAVLRTRRHGARNWSSSPMRALGNDRFEGEFTPEQPGRYEIEVVGGVDELTTWAEEAGRRLAAAVDDPNDPPRGVALLEAAAQRTAPVDREAAHELGQLAKELGADPERLTAVLAGLAAGGLGERAPLAELGGDGPLVPVFAARPLAACSAWYECFPRSTSPDPGRAGTLRDLVGRLDYVAELGFDVLYLPPIHPIGTTARKGPNNAPGAGGVGSPWAIGSPAGGHTAIAPELGSLEDFDDLLAAAARRGIEIALDLAFQCSPDHPWVAEHPEWFAHRPDGTIACAENPPKRYEDVYPLDFSTSDPEGLYAALREIVGFWVGRGVRIFRVDNPHTKPFATFARLIEEVRREEPAVIFLAEAFTRPKVMHRLAKLGFDQSYTYFTWRDSKYELVEYLSELARGPGAAYFRPNLWTNTPDILAKSLQHGGRPSFVARLVLAACTSANYGIYGPVFELLLDRPVAPGSEEYDHSEKYEVRHFDLDDPRSIAPVITRVNAARRDHPALRRDDTLTFHPVPNDQLCCWSKRDPERDDSVLCVVNLDPTAAQMGTVRLDLGALGLGADEPFVLEDLLDDRRYEWRGAENFLLLDPDRDNAHLFAIHRGAR